MSVLFYLNEYSLWTNEIYNGAALSKFYFC